MLIKKGNITGIIVYSSKSTDSREVSVFVLFVNTVVFTVVFSNNILQHIRYIIITVVGHCGAFCGLKWRIWWAKCILARLANRAKMSLSRAQNVCR